MDYLGLSVLNILLFLVSVILVTAIQNQDFRKISFEDVRDNVNTRMFQRKDVQDISEVAVDLPGNQIILGAKNYLMRLDLDSLHVEELKPWSPPSLIHKICVAKGQTRENCQNYVRVLIIHNKKLFVCGTNAFSPVCTWRQTDDLTKVIDTVQGMGKCPYHPKQNSSSLMLSNGDYFSATYTDFAGRDPAIYRIMGPSKPLRTVQHNSRWLNDPNFVSSYEIGDFIYLFFREMAVETNCDPGVYSRVARICKNDQGGNFLLEDNWTTFVKARLNCSLSGAIPFAFSEIQSTYYDHSKKLIHVVFTTPASSIYGSAVCVYNMNNLEKAFRGPFTYQENAQMAWNRVPNNLPQSQCGASNKRSLSKNDTPAQRVLMDAQKYQIMYDPIQPMGKEPYIVSENERYTHIAVDQVETADNTRLEVVFLATLEGTIKKMVKLPGKKKACLIEEISVTPENRPKPVRSMELLRGKRVLIVSTGDKVIRLSVHRCVRHNTRNKCLNAKDPYCAWNSSRCISFSPGDRSRRLMQDLKSCPQLKFTVDGEWSQWSKWSACKHIGKQSSDQCKCRYRTCDNPAPQMGGKDCSGSGIEVTSCITNGAWTPWSEWSGCSESCGSAQKFRKRTCTNPAPSHGGRVCVGPHTDMDQCKSRPCPLPPNMRAKWANWGTWSQCTHKCGGGMQFRTRRCERPRVAGHDDNDCVGNDQDYTPCNTQPCGDIRESSPWSDWVKMNMTRDGHMESRFQSVCVASVEGSHQIKSRLKTKMRFCPANGRQCHEESKNEEDDEKVAASALCSWADWSGWSDCDRPCSGGTRVRERMCEGGKGLCNKSECEGHGKQIRECNTHSCQGVWSCWNDWTACSVSCGQGRRTRIRQCGAEIGGMTYTHTCKGPGREADKCDMQPCGVGWNDWTVWSVCSTDGLQQRKRDCEHGSQFQQCQGVGQETRMCEYNKIDVMSSDPINIAATDRGGFCLKAFHLIVIGTLGFILGGFVCVGILLVCQRHRNDNRERALNEKYATLQKIKEETEVRANHYVCPADLDIHIPPAALNNKYYSTGSLKRKDSFNKMTVKEATIKRNSLLRTGSLLRTSTNFDNMDHDDF